MEKIFNKLVRDKIPEIINNNNEVAVTRILDDINYRKELIKKLLEEYNEVKESDKDNILEELADMLEIIETIAKLENKTLNDLLKIKEEKKQKRGGFDNKIFLIKTYKKSNLND